MPGHGKMGGKGKEPFHVTCINYHTYSLGTCKGYILCLSNAIWNFYLLQRGTVIKVLAYYFADTDSVFCFATDILCYLWQIAYSSLCLSSPSVKRREQHFPASLGRIHNILGQ